MFSSRYLYESISSVVIIRKFSSKVSSKSKILQDLLLKMPKDNKHILEAQKQRLKIKARAARYPPGVINIQILGNGSPGSPAVVYLFSDQSRLEFHNFHNVKVTGSRFLIFYFFQISDQLWRRKPKTCSRTQVETGSIGTHFPNSYHMGQDRWTSRTLLDSARSWSSESQVVWSKRHPRDF